MIKRTTEQWQALFIAHDKTDLSAAEFCRQHNLCPKYFSLRRKQLSGQAVKMKKTTVFVKARVPAMPRFAMESIQLRHGPCQLMVPSSVSPEWLAALITSLS